MQEILLDDYEQEVHNNYVAYCTRSVDTISIDTLIEIEHQLFDNMDFN
jgi:hypothetical protein